MNKLLENCFLFLLLGTSSLVGGLTAAEMRPLDALSVEEYAIVLKVLQQEGHADNLAVFNSIDLLPPPKEFVLKWTPGEPSPRAAAAIVSVGKKFYRAEVDLIDQKLMSWVVAPGQGRLTEDDMRLASSVAKRDARFVAAMAERGIDDLNKLRCISLASGTYGRREEQEQRTFKTTCSVRLTEDGPSVPVEGVVATVDVITESVLSFVDTGVVPLPPDPWGHSDQQIAERFGGRGKKAHATEMTQAEGPGYTIDGGHLQWDIWKFNFATDDRAGVSLNNVEVRDGDKWRRVLYELYLSEVFVPYSDPSEGWYWRTYMDSGEYGFGDSMTTLIPGVDCPTHATFIDTLSPDTTGAVENRNSTICVFERSNGDPAWRRRDNGRPATELVVRYAAAVGNYDYLMDYVFRQDGSIKTRVGAVGIDAVKAVAAESMDSPTAADDTRYGTLIRPNLVAPNHTHFFNFRIDFDIDGRSNSFKKVKLVPTKTNGRVPRSSIWTTEAVIPAREKQAVTKINLATPALLTVFNPNVSNALQQHPGYVLHPDGSATHSLLDVRDVPVKRNSYVDNQYWVTAYDPGERYAGGEYAVQSNGSDTLGSWVDANRPIENTDIVSWYTVGFHHVPRSEDWPVMPAHWVEFTLAPFNFFDRNPAINVDR